MDSKNVTYYYKRNNLIKTNKMNNLNPIFNEILKPYTMKTKTLECPECGTHMDTELFIMPSDYPKVYTEHRKLKVKLELITKIIDGYIEVVNGGLEINPKNEWLMGKLDSYLKIKTDLTDLNEL